jgi:hypothetical protein
MNANPLAVIVLAVMWIKFCPGTSYLLMAVLALAAVAQAVVRSRRAVAALSKDRLNELAAWEQFRRPPADLADLLPTPSSADAK